MWNQWTTWNCSAWKLKMTHKVSKWLFRLHRSGGTFTCKKYFWLRWIWHSSFLFLYPPHFQLQYMFSRSRHGEHDTAGIRTLVADRGFCPSILAALSAFPWYFVTGLSPFAVTLACLTAVWTESAVTAFCLNGTISDTVQISAGSNQTSA